MLTLSVADENDRRIIYALRHRVYATELGQHRENPEGLLTDALDRVNTYLVAKRAGAVVAFVAITPPNPFGYSVDKYFSRSEVPVTFDEGLFEVRLLTVIEASRRSLLAPLLMYAAFRYVDAQGARTLVAIGRREVLDLYRRAGLRPHGVRTQSGAVTYELMSADVASLRLHMREFETLIRRFERTLEWRVDCVPYRRQEVCVHGGAFWHAIGESFESLEKSNDVISADVLDAWFDPAPRVVQALARYLPFVLKTSPPTGADGMRRVVARVRGIGEENVLTAAGSSDLIFSALRGWITSASHVLVLDPMYGEYVYVLERMIGATVDRLRLSRASGYRIEPERLADALSRGYDWALVVNPNSPTGTYLAKALFERVLAEAPRKTRFWIDETYVDYVAEDQSLEAFAAASSNVVVAKSMSKAYALSGVRAAYLCGPASLVAEASRWRPPWAVSLPGQIAACEALTSMDYYRARWRETAELRSELRAGLEAQHWDVVPGCANFLLCHLPEDAPEAATLAARLRTRGLFVRDVSGLSSELGPRAVRIAVKDGATNRRMLDLIAEARVRLKPDATYESASGT
jgi:histidinol-phosphate/aromatic aminotransferase/cobyric acid decarboxylase-like protein